MSTNPPIPLGLNTPLTYTPVSICGSTGALGGIEKSPHDSMRWYQQSANQGNKDAIKKNQYQQFVQEIKFR